MATPVEMPKLGNTVEECLIARWAKRKGDVVNEGDLVAEIETDKATFEVTAPVEGTVLETFFAEGALVPVFTNLFVIGTPGEDPAPYRPGGQGGVGLLACPSEGETFATKKGADQEVYPTAPQPSASGGSLSPRARRFAEERNFNPIGVPGTGPGGRVLEEDLRRAFFEGVRPAPAPAPVPAPPPAAKPATIREKIARRMREALSSTAQYTLHSSADATGLLAARAKLKPAPININDLVAYCTVRVLAQFPALNATTPEIHLGFACDTPRGLLVPVVRDAHTLGLADLAAKMKTLANQAVEGKLSPDDMTGGTFTISNLGPLGIESFTPILTPPQLAILGVGAIQLKPVRRDGTIAFIDSIALSLTCDHQFIDGAPGARFLQAVAAEIARAESICTI
jgi:pyruvate dehydrogenase E2 component (dihydrolipoamide acetyltransferase)